MKRLLREAWTQAKEKLEAVYKAIAEGTYRVEGNKLYAPDGMWMYVDTTVHILIHSIRRRDVFSRCVKAVP
jgi:hypothetical protein